MEPSEEADESAAGSTKDLMAAFSDKVQNWEVKQSKPIDLFKKGIYLSITLIISLVTRVI